MTPSNPTPTSLASTAMEAARETTDYLNNEDVPTESGIASIFQKHFQPLLAKVEAERDAAFHVGAQVDRVVYGKIRLAEQENEIASLRTALAAKNGGKWVDRPNRNGWWFWKETGRGHEERLLLVANGASVASDDEWQQATGKPAEDEERGINHNYWEGSDTTQRIMPGMWRFDAESQEKLLNALRADLAAAKGERDAALKQNESGSAEYTDIRQLYSQTCLTIATLRGDLVAAKEENARWSKRMIEMIDRETFLELERAQLRADLAAKEATATENEELAEIGQKLSELVWGNAAEGDDAYEVEDILESHYKLIATLREMLATKERVLADLIQRLESALASRADKGGAT